MLDCFCCLLKPKNYDLLHLYCRSSKIIFLFLCTKMTPTGTVGMINAHNTYRVSICPEDSMVCTHATASTADRYGSTMKLY